MTGRPWHERLGRSIGRNALWGLDSGQAHLRRGGADLLDRAATAPVGLLTRILFGLSFLFMALPGIDLAVAGWFAGPQGGFPLQASPALNLVRQLNHSLTLALLLLAATSVLAAAARWPTRWLMRPYKALFLFAVYAAGPGIVVNLMLKNLFGRARPREIAEFGGDLAFSGPWQMVGSCVGNCSFTSGEAASAASLLAIALLVPRPWRPPVLIALALPAAVFSLNRIAFGGHFLSDVVMSWLIVTIVMLLIWPFFAGSAAAIDRSVAASGEAVRQLVHARIGFGRRPASP